jgi:hypothetical protein
MPTDRTPALVILSFGLATFQSAILVLAIFTILHLSRDLGSVLNGLSTWFGITLFGGLWVISWYVTFNAVGTVLAEKEDFSVSDSTFLVQALLWGGIGGCAFLLFYLAIGVPPEFLADAEEGNPLDLLVLLPFILVVVGGIGSIFAFPIGSIIGIVFALFYAVLVSVARVFLGRTPSQSSPGEPGETKEPLPASE